MTTPSFARVALGTAAVAGALVGAGFLVKRYLDSNDIHVLPRTSFGLGLVYTVEWDDGEPVRVLSVKGMYQSATYLDERYCEPVFDYYRLYDRAFEGSIPVHNVCMVGGGGYSYPKHLVATRPEARIDVVEIDPTVTALARQFFFLDRLELEFDTEETGRLGLIEGDGRAYLERYARDASLPRYDAVMNDSFSGGEPAACLATLEAARAAKACLTPGGAYLSNVVSAVEGPDSRFLRAIAATLAQVFTHVYAVPCGDDLAECDNVMVIATDGAGVFSGAIELTPAAGDLVLTDAHCPVRELCRPAR